jgi:aminoglycoside 2''-phosphotransferase
MDLDDQHARELQQIRARCPELRISSVRVQTGGQRSDVLVINDALVFRFPRTPAGAHSLAAETAILRAIAGRVPLPTPTPRFEYLAVDDAAAGPAFVGYPWLPGQPLRRALLQRLDLATQRHLASQLGGFLHALHTIPPQVLPGGLDVQDGRARWLDFYARVHATLFASMRPAARRDVERHFETYLASGEELAFRPVLRHGDFGPTNILYDSSAGSISGIIDFGSAGLGDPATDIAGLLGPLSYGEAFVDLLAPAYPDLEALLGRARFYAGTFALQEALWGVEHDDQDAVRRGLLPYR